jgi:flagellar secretion chaperone FliS
MNNSYAQAVGAYSQAAAHVPPQVAIVLLYDKAIQAIRRAKDQATMRRLDDAYASISRAGTILLGLLSNLRFEDCAELATTLKHTYVCNIVALHDGFGKPDMAERYDKLLAGLTELRNSWAQNAGLPEVPVRSA